MSKLDISLIFVFTLFHNFPLLGSRSMTLSDNEPSGGVVVK